MRADRLRPQHEVFRLDEEVRDGELSLAQFAVGLHEVTLDLNRDGRVFAEIQENITRRLYIRNYVGAHGGVPAPASAPWCRLVQDEDMRYESNLKHKEPWQRGRRGTLCPGDIDQAIARQLLEDSELEGGKRYAVHGGRAYCAQDNGANVWHGYPVGWIDVPEHLRRRWLREGRVQRREIKRHWHE